VWEIQKKKISQRTKKNNQKHKRENCCTLVHANASVYLRVQNEQ